MPSHSCLIAAIATPPGHGGVGIIRISGTDLSRLTYGILGFSPQPRHAHFTPFFAEDRQVLDEGLALYFPAPHSFTGEEVLELQAHGGPVVLKMVLRRCIELGARHANPGEFTQRAFLNGKLDLVQAESIADLINAQSEQAVRSALRSLSGAFSDEIHRLLEGLTHLRMQVEAGLDFPEEEIDPLETCSTQKTLVTLQKQLHQILNTAKQGQLLREGVHIVLIGQPNVGKSSLMNRLSGDEVAIVTDIAGTTRDTLRASILLEGVPFHIIDTAGLRETRDPLEKIGIERTWAAIEKADLALLLLDSKEGITPQDQVILRRLPGSLPVLYVFNKIDLTGETAGIVNNDQVYLSALTGMGLPALRQMLLERVGWHGTADVFIARERHLNAIHQAASHLETALNYVKEVEIFAEELRLAQSRLSEITGEFTPDDLLGIIFSRFCIGK